MPLRLFALFLACAALAGRSFAADHPLALDPAASHLEVAVRATGDSFTARLSSFAATIATDDAGRVNAAQVRFHFRDLATGKPKRDDAMHAWQDTKQFPDGRFELLAIEEQPAAGAPRARGRLTLHGVTRELQFPVSVMHEGNLYSIDGDVALDTREFGLPIIRLMLVLKVDPVVHVRFHLQGRRQP